MQYQLICRPSRQVKRVNDLKIGLKPLIAEYSRGRRSGILVGKSCTVVELVPRVLLFQIDAERCIFISDVTLECKYHVNQIRQMTSPEWPRKALALLHG